MLDIKHKIHLVINRLLWWHQNRHNSTGVANIFKLSSVTVGNFSYGGLYVIDSNPVSKLNIGNFCSIAPHVTFILNSDHYTTNVSSFPFKVMCLGESQPEAISYGNIIVEDDVWIGYGAVVLSGVHIGQGAIVASGAVVSKDVPPYAIVGGVPARVIRYRFTKEVVDYLLTLDYSALTKELVAAHLDDLYLRIDDLDISSVQTKFAWFPKKRT